MVDELSAGTVPELEDDPYQVYMLRRPAERSSSVVPQLPKQPEMADTRLRYRRIAPEARSGSFGSLGGHFPPRFEFPNRRSLLESLTSDDEASSFAVRTRRDPDKPRKKKKKRAPKPPQHRPDPDHPDHLPQPAQKPPLPSPKHLPPIAIALPTDDLPALDASDSSTPLSTSPTTPVPGSPIEGRLAFPLPTPDPQPQLDSTPIHLPDNQAPVPDSHPHPNSVPSNPAPEPQSSQAAEPQAIPGNRRTLSPRQIVLPHKDDKPRVSDPSTVKRALSHHRPAPHPADSAAVKRSDSHGISRRVRSDATPRRMHSAHSPEASSAATMAGITVSVDGRPISAPAAMDPALREKFVLRPEQPVAYGKSSSPRAEGVDRPRPKKKTSRKKKRETRPPRPPKRETKSHRREEAVVGNVEEDMFARDKELSVSFAHRRYTAEEAAARPLNAIQRLWNFLAFARMSVGGKGRRS